MESNLDENQIFDDGPDFAARKKIILRNGTIFVFVLIIVMLVTHIFRASISDQAQRIAWGEYLLLLVTIIVTQLDIRSKVYAGKISFGQAFTSGMLFVAFVAGVFSIFTLVFYLAIGPEVLKEMVVIAENSLREKGLTEDQIDAQMAFSSRIFTPVGMFVMTIIGYLFVGAIMSLIASLFTQRQR